MGATTPPSCAAASMIPCTLPLSVPGNQREITRAALGNAPASPTPNKKRMAISEPSPEQTPVNAVKSDHHRTTRVRILRDPYLSPILPVGISNNPYANVNAMAGAAKIAPKALSERLRRIRHALLECIRKTLAEEAIA